MQTNLQFSIMKILIRQNESKSVDTFDLSLEFVDCNLLNWRFTANFKRDVTEHHKI